MIGSILSGKYRVDSQIASGGMGVLYRGEHVALHRPVAIKVLHQTYAGNQLFIQRFLREARSMAKLDHDRIVRVFDVAEEAGQPYIVMELFVGRDLRMLLRERERLPTGQTLAIAKQVAQALAYAHAKGVVHRDIKPANVLIDDQGAVKLTDFGIAAVGEMTVTGTGELLGTPEYMSPEQVRAREQDGRSDLYSLGMVMYELLTGRTALAGMGKTAIVGRLYRAQEAHELVFGADVPVGLQRVVEALLQMDADQRPADATVLLAQLDALDQRMAPSQSNAAVSLPREETLAGEEIRQIVGAGFIPPGLGTINVRRESGETNGVGAMNCAPTKAAVGGETTSASSAHGRPMPHLRGTWWAAVGGVVGAILLVGGLLVVLTGRDPRQGQPEVSTAGANAGLVGAADGRDDRVLVGEGEAVADRIVTARLEARARAMAALRSRFVLDQAVEGRIMAAGVSEARLKSVEQRVVDELFKLVRFRDRDGSGQSARSWAMLERDTVLSFLTDTARSSFDLARRAWDEGRARRDSGDIGGALSVLGGAQDPTVMGMVALAYRQTLALGTLVSAIDGPDLGALAQEVGALWTGRNAPVLSMVDAEGAVAVRYRGRPLADIPLRFTMDDGSVSVSQVATTGSDGVARVSQPSCHSGAFLFLVTAEPDIRPVDGRSPARVSTHHIRRPCESVCATPGPGGASGATSEQAALGRIRAELNKTRFVNGEDVRVAIDVREASYLYVLNVSEGKVALLYPTGAMPATRVAASTRVVLPEERYDRFRLRVYTPPGSESSAEGVLVLASDKPLDVGPSAVRATNNGTTTNPFLRRGMAASLEAGAWSQAGLPYCVTDH